MLGCSILCKEKFVLAIVGGQAALVLCQKEYEFTSQGHSTQPNNYLDLLLYTFSGQLLKKRLSYSATIVSKQHLHAMLGVVPQKSTGALRVFCFMIFVF